MRSILASVLVLGMTGAPAGAASGDLLWSEARVAGSARNVAVGARALAVSAVDPSGTSPTIRVYDPGTGSLRRSFPRAGGIGALLVRGGLIVASEGSDLVALNLRNGRERWRVPLAGSATLVGAGSRIFAATDDGVLTAHALRTGEVLWTNDDGPVAEFVVRQGRIAAVGTRQPAGEIPRLVARVLNGRTGAEVWRVDDAFQSTRGASGRCVTWAGGPILVGGLVTRDDVAESTYYEDPLVVAYDPRSGAPLWIDEVSAAADMAVVGLATREDQAFALIRRTSGLSYEAKAYDVHTGQQLWHTGRTPIFTDGTVSGPLLVGGELVFAADSFENPSEFVATALRAADGSVAWSADAHSGGATANARDLVTDGKRLFVVGSVSSNVTPEPTLGVWAYSLP